VHSFLTTGQPEEFARIGRRFLGPELESVHQFAQATSWVRA
jgi:glutamate racemase